MASDFTRVRFLLDEHYPGWLAEDLTADGYDTVALTAHRPELRGADDGRVLAAAVAEGRVVVTEDVSTFSRRSRSCPAISASSTATTPATRAHAAAWKGSARPSEPCRRALRRPRRPPGHMVALRRIRLKAHHEPRLSGMRGVLTDMMTADGPGTPGEDSIWPYLISILRSPSDRRAAWLNSSGQTSHPALCVTQG
jgi:uncharacterized protein with PIN domain